MGKPKGGARLQRKKPDDKKEKKPGKAGKAIKIILIVLALLTILAAGLYIWYRHFFAVPPPIPPIDGDDSAFHAPEWNEDDASFDGGRAPQGITDADRKRDFFTLLIIGVDGGANTDTIMLASYDALNEEANLVSIPRDTLVNVNRRTKKINAAYPSGTLNGGGLEGGVAQLRREVKTLIGFVPDYYVVVNLRAFERIIDAVNGVEIDVPYAMRYDDPTQNLHINIAKGQQTLNGSDSLKFARYRRGNAGYRTISDYERIENQQTVIRALMDKLISPASLGRIPEFISIFTENVSSDLTAGNLAWFGEKLAGLRGTDALSSYTLPMAGSSGSPGWYEYADRDAVLELVNATINPYNVPIKPEDVDILNKVP